MSSADQVDDGWATVPTRKNTKDKRDAVKEQKAAAAAVVAAANAPKNRGTVLCHYFISPEGCSRGDLCNFRHSLDPPVPPTGGAAGTADSSSWRRGNGTKPPSAADEQGDVDDVTAALGNASLDNRNKHHHQHHHHHHHHLNPAMRERVERVSKMDVPAEYLSALPDIDFTPNPLEKVILSYLYSTKITPQFDISFQQADSNFVNLQVGSYLEFPESLSKPSLVDFSKDQVQELVKFLQDEAIVKQLADVGGIYTWAEGSFRQKTAPNYHGYLRVCKFLLMDTDPAIRSPLLEAMLHTFEYTLADMYYDLQTPESAATVELATSTFLNVRKRLTLEGKPSDVFIIRRQVDGMLLGLWDSLKSNHFNTLWYPFNKSCFRKVVAAPGNWFKLPTEDHPDDERYFYLFGFDDRETKNLLGVTDVQEKANFKNAKFIRLIEENVPSQGGIHRNQNNIKKRIKATKNRSEATKFFQENNESCLQVVSTANNQKTITQSIKCPLIRKRGIEEADQSVNTYFELDLEGLNKIVAAGPVNLWNKAKKSTVSAEDFSQYVLLHPFLPIIAFKRAEGDNKTAVLLETLRRIQILLQALTNEESTEPCDCEVVLYLSNLQKEARSAEKNTKGPTGTTASGNLISTAVPGYNTEDFSSAMESEWNEIVAYSWLLPSTFYQSGLLSTEQAANWLKKFEQKGEKFKVIS